MIRWQENGQCTILMCCAPTYLWHHSGFSPKWGRVSRSPLWAAWMVLCAGMAQISLQILATRCVLSSGSKWYASNATCQVRHLLQTLPPSFRSRFPISSLMTLVYISISLHVNGDDGISQQQMTRHHTVFLCMRHRLWTTRPCLSPGRWTSVEITVVIEFKVVTYVTAIEPSR